MINATPSGNPRRSNLRDRVGNGLPNTPADILWLKEALTRLGRYHDGGNRHPYIDRGLATAIAGYQRDRGLKRDGMLTPGGETECTICVELGYLLGRMAR